MLGLPTDRGACISVACCFFVATLLSFVSHVRRWTLLLFAVFDCFSTSSTIVIVKVGAHVCFFPSATESRPSTPFLILPPFQRRRVVDGV